MLLSSRDASWAVMPADARTHVFESATEATQLWIKGEGFTLGRLMGGTARHMDLHNCSLVISRWGHEARPDMGSQTKRLSPATVLESKG